MLRFVCDPALLTQMRANAQIMREGPTWEEIASQYMSLYRSLQ